MTRRSVLARAPANIAFIKYMGKQEGLANFPANQNLSLTLNHFQTWVEMGLESNPFGSSFLEVRWDPLLPQLLSQDSFVFVPELNEDQKKRVGGFLQGIESGLHRLLQGVGLETHPVTRFWIRSANTFPAGAGIASSASSFAAITLAFAGLLCVDPVRFEAELRKKGRLRSGLAQLSRQGSGSSCRSFGGPWVKWMGESIDFDLTHRLPPLVDFILLVDPSPKKISSSEAHRRVLTSPLWEGRCDRANRRVREFEEGLFRGDLTRLAQLAFIEAMEMHSLFHTSQPSFTYWQPKTVQILRWVSEQFESDPSFKPLVTLDAGSNVHVVVPSVEVEFWRDCLVKQFNDIPLLQDIQGDGPEFLPNFLNDGGNP